MMDLEYIDTQIQTCGSAIERIMCLALHYVGLETKTFPLVETQVTHRVNDAKYRVDFDIELLDRDYEHVEDYVSANVIVECDGHDFHERTKEQAQKDKSRDRALMTRGVPVMRFTGSEIYNNPIKCACEVLNYLGVELERKTNG